jgi:hypothetical protein
VLERLRPDPYWGFDARLPKAQKDVVLSAQLHAHGRTGPGRLLTGEGSAGPTLYLLHLFGACHDGIFRRVGRNLSVI